MARLITIEISGSAGNYEAMVRRISEQNNKLYAGVQQGAAQAVTSVRASRRASLESASSWGNWDWLELFQGVNFLNTFTAWQKA